MLMCLNIDIFVPADFVRSRVMLMCLNIDVFVPADFVR